MTEHSQTKLFGRSCFFFHCFIIVFYFAVLILLSRLFPTLKTLTLTVIALMTSTSLMIAHDLLKLQVHRRDSTGLRFDRPSSGSRERVVVKLIGLWATLMIASGFYSLSYYQKPFYQPYFVFLGWILPVVVIVSAFYFFEVDRHQIDPCDDHFWHMGCLLTGRLQLVSWPHVTEHLKVWFIKAFFAPIMFGILIENTHQLMTLLEHGWGSFYAVYDFLLTFFYAIDVIFGLLGYILTLRLLDTHVRSTDPTGIGWLSCLMCYAPFSLYFGLTRLPYEDGFQWQHWLSFSPVAYFFIGSTIIALTAVYTLATVAFGYRMSNMTYRGLIDSGPYRFTKHPAYIGKVASWWLISLPFFGTEDLGMICLYTVNLTIISVIYFIRAKTEEHHLSYYQEYVDYALWMNENGVFKRLGRIFPFLKFSTERYRQWKNPVWFLKSKRN